MDTFFALLKKSLVATLFVIFAFVGTYVPQNFNEVETVHAAGGRSTFGGQLMLNISALAGNVEAAASAAYGAVTSALTKLMSKRNYIWTALLGLLLKTLFMKWSVNWSIG